MLKRSDLVVGVVMGDDLVVEVVMGDVAGMQPLHVSLQYRRNRASSQNSFPIQSPGTPDVGSTVLLNPIRSFTHGRPAMSSVVVRDVVAEVAVSGCDDADAGFGAV